MKAKRWARPALPTTTAVEARLLPELAPRLERLADDAWALAQRAPSVAADPALVAEAGRLLAAVRRLRCREPGYRLLPQSFPAGIRLHALALSLRQLQAATTRFTARRQPAAGHGVDEAIDDINRLNALVLRSIASDIAERLKLELPADLQPPAKHPDNKVIPAPLYPR
ncbi:MAG: hypothetical protein ACTHLT_10040 [Devosia sp.]